MKQNRIEPWTSKIVAVRILETEAMHITTVAAEFS